MVRRIWLASVALLALCVAGVATPIPSPRKYKPGEIIPNKVYYMMWGPRSRFGKTIFYDCGHYQYHYVHKQWDDTWEQKEIWGSWNWDSKTRTLKFKELFYDYQPWMYDDTAHTFNGPNFEFTLLPGQLISDRHVIIIVDYLPLKMPTQVHD